MAVETIQQVKEIFKSVFPKDLKPLENREGIVIGEAVRIHRENNRFVVRFLKGSAMGFKKQYLDRLKENKVDYTEGPEFTTG